jgi:hypothetical protein
MNFTSLGVLGAPVKCQIKQSYQKLRERGKKECIKHCPVTDIMLIHEEKINC